ncbi:MAG: paraquat-inducible protein A [Bacteroidales bacterium]|nr:paraquat-inducible protein A [Bacteroidales bacterium]
MGSSIGFFVLGLIFPIISTKKHIFGITLSSGDIRLLDSVRIFYAESEYLLAFVILFFTVIFPCFKYVELLNRKVRIFRPGKRISGFLQKLDKWSMLDVFIVALLILNFKMDSRIIVMKIKIGTNFLVISIVLRMIAAYFFRKNISKNN